jgi:hypothetical protein
LADHTSLIVELQVATTAREDEVRATDTTLEQLFRTETSGSLERTVIKDQNRSKKGQQQASTLQTSNDVQSSTPSLPLSHADRVLTQFTDGKWYTGNIHGDYPKGHLILFDGYESHGVSKISFHLVKPYITVKLPHEHPPSTPDRTTATNLEELKRANTATQQRSNAAT